MENNLCSDLFQKTVQNASEKNWMEKSPFRMEKSAFIFLKRFSVACSYFAKKKWWKRFSKKVNGYFSILNGDFSILNGEKFLENNLQRIFKKKVENASEKFERRNLHSEWRNLHSLFFEKRFASVFSKKEAFFTSKVVEKRLFFFWMEMIFQYFFWPGRSEINKKNTNYSFFSIQNGEISILNGDFSIHSFSEAFWTFFWKKSQQRIFSI